MSEQASLICTSCSYRKFNVIVVTMLSLLHHSWVYVLSKGGEKVGGWLYTDSRLKTVNELEFWFAYSMSWLYFARLCLVPTGAPTSLTAVQFTTNSLTLSWDPPRSDQQNGIIRYYIVYIADVTNGTAWQLNVNTTRTTIRNLTPFFTYNCSVAPFTVGRGPTSASVVVTLPQAG